MRKLGVSALAALLVLASSPALANHGGVHATCAGEQPVVTQRPPGKEHIVVVCVDGIPEFRVAPKPVASFDPITQAMPLATPPDFGGWVTVWLNGRPLKTPYDPIRGLQEPGAYLSKSTGRVMMPVRFFTTAFGGTVDWSDSERRARLFLKDKVMAVWMGEKTTFVNAQSMEMDQAPVNFQDRIFVPVRTLMEAFGAKVTWDHSNRSARVELEGAACVHPVYCGEAR